MDAGISRTFSYTVEFYLKRIGLIVIFSIPFILAFLIQTFVPAPTYLSLGGVFLRTESLPELSILDVIVTFVAYALAVFIIADTIVNINIVVRSKRTLTSIGHEVVSAMGTYAARIFLVYTCLLLVLFAAQIITYDNPLQPLIYPFIGLLLSAAVFFVPPAVVIDNLDPFRALSLSATMALRNLHLVIIWSIIALLSVSILTIIADVLFTMPFSGYFVLLINSLIVLPFLTVLQTQMYMEKYPLAR